MFTNYKPLSFNGIQWGGVEYFRKIVKYKLVFNDRICKFVVW